MWYQNDSNARHAEGTPKGTVVGDSLKEVRKKWQDAECSIEEVTRESPAFLLLTKTMREVALASMAVLCTDLLFRAFVPGYRSPDWVPLLLSGGAVTAPLSAVIALVRKNHRQEE